MYLGTAIRKETRAEILSRGEAIAFQLEGRIRRAVLAALNEMTDEVTLRQIVTLLESGKAGDILALIDTSKLGGAIESIKAEFVAAVAAAGANAARAPVLRGVGFMFDVLNPRLVDWMQQYSFGLVRDIDAGTKEGIRAALVQGMAEGKGPLDTARQVRSVVGLTERQAKAVLNYRKELETFHLRRTGGGYNVGGKIDRVHGTQVYRPLEDGTPKDGITERRLRDFRYDGQLNRAMESKTPLKPEQIDKMVAAYQRKYLKHRAETIARTESIRANNIGVLDAWRQAIASGKIPEAQVRKSWLVARDERLCKVCQPIPGLNPKMGLPLGQAFQTPKGPIVAPPIHPSCRCALNVRMYETHELA